MHLSQEEIDTSEEQKQARNEFDAAITTKFGAEAAREDFDDDVEDPLAAHATPLFDLYEDDEQDAVQTTDRDDLEDNIYDKYLNAEVTLPRGSFMEAARVKRRKIESDGRRIGRSNQNPILDTHEYAVEFPDGAEAEYSANVIAENMYAQCDFDGNQYLLMDSITDHKADGHAVKKADGMTHHNGRAYPKKTTKGWHLCVKWKDGSTSWERLADVKESNPVQTAEYAKALGISDEPAFVWWVD